MVNLTPAIARLWYRVNPEELYPPFLEMVIKGQRRLLRKRKTFFVTQAVRSYEDQAKLYAYGRTDMSRKFPVTNAPPGRSCHNFWCATDHVYDKDAKRKGLQPTWDKHHYKYLADAMVAEGLEAGFYWRNLFDGPHIQLPLRKHGLNTRKLRRAYRRGGKERVFALLDLYDWTS